MMHGCVKRGGLRHTCALATLALGGVTGFRTPELDTTFAIGMAEDRSPVGCCRFIFFLLILAYGQKC